MIKDSRHEEIGKMVEEEGTIFTKIEEMASKYSKRPALIFLGEVFTYSRLMSLINRFAGSVSRVGIKTGDRVMIYLPNSPQFVIAYFGLQKIGAIPVPVSPIYTPYEIRYMLNNSGAETVICADTNFGYVKSILPETDVERVIVTNIADLLPGWKRWMGRFFDKIPKGNVTGGDNIFSFKNLLKHEKIPEVSFDPRKHPAHILYTGGTTGLPKGVVHTHSFLLSGIIGIREVYHQIDEAQHSFVTVTPLYHMFTLDMLLATVLHKGNTAIIMPKPNIDAVLDAIQYYEATLFAGVPTLYRMILEHDRLDFYDLSSLEYCWSAGDVLPAEIYRRWKERFGIPIHQVYGSTETVVISITRLDSDPVVGSVGSLIPGRLAKLVDEDEVDGALKEVNEGEGELLISSEYLDTGYWQNPDETARGYVKIDDLLWCRTGDFIRFADGNLFFVDRRKDIIKYKGYRIAASEVEAVLQDHPAVMAASVVGVPDERVGERIKAFVVLKEDARGVMAQDLIRWCREKLAPYKVPDYIEFRDFLPKSKVGKVLRRELRDQEVRRKSG